MFIRDLLEIVRGGVPLRRLKKHGLIIGKGFKRGRNCFIDPSFPYLIQIGDDVTFSINVTVLAHDASIYSRLNACKIGKVKIGSNVFVGANTIILCGVTIGDNCVIGAGSVVTKSFECGNVVLAGNPAKVIMSYDDYIKKYSAQINNIFDRSYWIKNKPNKEKIKEIIEATDNRISYIE